MRAFSLARGVHGAGASKRRQVDLPGSPEMNADAPMLRRRRMVTDLGRVEVGVAALARGASGTGKRPLV